MKKLIIVLVLLALPLSLFAQGFYLGASALYKGDPLNPPTTLDPSIVDNLAFGLDARFTLAIFEVQALALYNLNQSFNAYIDAGLVFDIAIVSIGVGVGPNFVINFASGAAEAASFGFNGKAHLDLNLGPIKISAYYLILIDSISVADIQNSLYLGNVGLSVLFKLL